MTNLNAVGAEVTPWHQIIYHALDVHCLSFEGSITLLAEHLHEEHGIKQGFTAGVDQGTWMALNRLHWGAHLVEELFSEEN